MKIAFFLPRLRTLGGAELLALTQLEILSKAGHDPWIVTYDVGPDFDALRRRDAHAAALRVVSRGRGEPSALLRRLLWAHELAWVEDALGAADLVVAHNFPANAVLGLARIPGERAWYCHEPPRALHRELTCPRAARLARDPRNLGDPLARKLVIERGLHALDRAVHGPWQRLARRERAAVQAIPTVLCNSAFTLGAFRAAYGRDDGVVVHPIVPFEPRAHTRVAEPAAPRFLCHSRLQPEKNVGAVLRAFRHVRRRHAGATLQVVGTGPARAGLERLATRIPGVRFAGYLPTEALERAYDEADAFVAVPFDEPFGMVFPEAILRGLPVVGSDHAGPAEILEGGELGELADPTDERAIADAMLRSLSRSPAARAQAAAHMRARYGVATGTKRLLEALGL